VNAGKVAVIGTGRMGRRHIQVIRSLGLELVGVCDTQPASLALAANEEGVPEALHFSDARALLERTCPDCVVVATTAPTHCDYVCMAAVYGATAILCEKPLATSLTECDRMIDVCSQYGARLAVNHQMRFMQQYTEAKRITSTEGFGGLKGVTVIAGNFGLAMNGTHYFEMFRYLTGEAPVEVSAWFSRERLANPRGPQFEDRAGCVRLTTESGARFYIDASQDQGHGFQVHYSGRYGQLTVDEATGEMRLSQRDAEHRAQPTTRYLMPYKITRGQVEPADVIAPTRAVLEALLKGTDYPTGEDGRLAVHTLIAAHLSDERGGQPVRLDDLGISRERTFPWA